MKGRTRLFYVILTALFAALAAFPRILKKRLSPGKAFLRRHLLREALREGKLRSPQIPTAGSGQEGCIKRLIRFFRI